MRYYSIADIHAYDKIFLSIIEDTNIKTELNNRNAILLILGDLIDNGPNSYKCVHYAYSLQKQYPNNVIILKGNHEEWFLEFVNGNNDSWLYDDKNFNTTKSFLTYEQFKHVRHLVEDNRIDEVSLYVRNCINERHVELLHWMEDLPYFFECQHAIYVHAGIDEDAKELWKICTPNYTFTGKFPAQKGKFIKTIIAGHISSAAVADDISYLGKIYFDGESHYYIDGSVMNSRKIPILIYDSVECKYSELIVGE